MIKCECNKEAKRDGYDNIEIEDGYVCVKGTAYCECGRIFEYEDLYVVDLRNPFDTIVDDVTESYKSE